MREKNKKKLLEKGGKWRRKGQKITGKGTKNGGRNKKIKKKLQGKTRKDEEKFIGKILKRRKNWQEKNQTKNKEK